MILYQILHLNISPQTVPPLLAALTFGHKLRILYQILSTPT